MSDGAFPDRVTLLRNRWEADPSSRVFLQLAEEYRHQGRVQEALEVLDRGLKEHPGYLSALVAKGRCHLELGEPEPARAVLERVVKQDATQMVANKLLVRAYLETSDPDRARERLDLYSLLNDSDPEIDELRRRLQAMDQPPQGEKPGSPLPSESPFPDLDSAVPPPRREAQPAPPPGGDLFDLGLPPPRTAPRVRPDEPFADLMAPAAVTHAVAEPEPRPEPTDVLFPGLASPERRQRYLASLAAEGLFLLDLTAEAPPAEAPPREEPPPAPAPARVAGFQPEPLPEEEPFAAVLPELSWEPAEAPPPPPPLPPTAEAEPQPAAPAEEKEEAPIFDLGEPVPWAEEPAPLLAEEPAEEPVSPRAEAPAPLPPPLPAAAMPVPAAEPMSATLGELYLRQGHLGEAERIFREVLRREPGNAAAQQGLARAAARQGERRPLAAHDLLAGYRTGGATGEAEVRARKIWALNRYLERLRRGSQRDVS